MSLLDAHSKVVRPGLMIFWPCKDHLARYSMWREAKREAGEDWEETIREWTGLEFSVSSRGLQKTGKGGRSCKRKLSVVQKYDIS